jgi:magnesium transporter
MQDGGGPLRKDYRIADGRITQVLPPETGLIWLYIQPDEAEKRFLIDTCRIDEHTLNSSLDPDELSRLEIEPDHTAIIYKRPKNYSAKDKLVFKVASTGLFVFADKIVVVMDEEIPIFNIKQFQRVSSLGDVMLKLVYGSIFHFLEHLKIINYIVDELEQKINLSSIISTRSTPTRRSSTSCGSTRPSWGFQPSRRSFSMTFSSRTTSATNRPRSIRTFSRA